MKDKLIIIATIQNILMHMTLLMQHDPNKSLEKLGTLKGLSVILLDIYYAITGNYWAGSPKDLTFWMLTYIKNEADSLGDNKPTITLQLQ